MRSMDIQKSRAAAWRLGAERPTDAGWQVLALPRGHACHPSSAGCQPSAVSRLAYTSGGSHLHDRPDLDRAHAGTRNLCGNLARLVEVLRLDDVEAPELLARFREGAVRRDGLA